MSQSGRGALILAVETGFLHGVDSLLLRGADLNEADPDGGTLVCAAVMKQQTAMVEFLAARGADVCQPAKNGRTPMIIAATNGNVAALECLARLGADVDGSDEAVLCVSTSASLLSGRFGMRRLSL
eukprot:m.179396 g.179396  ORF g.179396 m.179396 type:complete len:126 (+) comp53422_c0_seq5:285-662(+)